MARGHETHQLRQIALQSLGKELARRARSRCELTGEGGIPLRIYEVPPVPAEPDAERCLLLGAPALEALRAPRSIDARQWRCLAEAVWSECPALQVVAWRLLRALAENGESWAADALEGAALEPEIEHWARDPKP